MNSPLVSVVRDNNPPMLGLRTRSSIIGLAAVGRGRYLEDVALRQLEGAGGDVDAFARLHLDAVHALVAVVVVHGVVWRQEHPLVVGDGGAALSCGGGEGAGGRGDNTYK